MNRDFVTQALAAAFFLLFSFFFAQTAVAQASATVYAVTSTNSLVRFSASTPGTLTTIGPVTGLQGGENVVGIDFRPATGELFAVGSNSRLYVINTTTAAATFVAALSTTLNGTSFGVDFNPTVDRLRIVASPTGQNLRVNPTNGATLVDGTLNPGTPQVTAAAYTNSFSGATTTTLYDIDSNSDTLSTQNPPNNGTLVTVGPLGLDVVATNGFDISTLDGTAFAALTTAASVTNLYTINLATGAATLVGAIGTGSAQYTGFAVEIGSAANYSVYGLTTANNLIRFNSARPNTILSTTPITGLQSGENVLGIDFRPATGQLFALGSTSRLYTINTVTGAATAIGAAGQFTLSGTNFGFDFNPLPDRIRIVSNTGQNLRVNPNDGTLTGTDGSLLGQVVAAAYINNFAGAPVTTLYDIDSASDSLLRQDPPNSGTLISVGPLGINITSEAGFDVTVGNNTALAALQLNGATSSGLYRINLTTGAASVIGPIGGGAVIRDIAIQRSTASGSATSTLDFNGDGRTDYAVFRPAGNVWFISPLADAAFYGIPFGLNSVDILTPGDYDGDGRTDIAVWRSTEGLFYVLRSSDQGITYFYWGISSDKPVPRDYDGDGRTDFAVVRQQGGSLVWYIFNSSNGSIRTDIFGLASDVATPGDYDGDGRFDLAVYRGSAPATFFVQATTAGFSSTLWGQSGDVAVPGDYDGDGKTDLAVVRATTPYTWIVLRSSDNGQQGATLGTNGSFPTQGDYDADGKTDFAVWNPNTGVTGSFIYQMSVNRSVEPQYRFGSNGDYPVANVFAN